MVLGLFADEFTRETQTELQTIMLTLVSEEQAAVLFNLYRIRKNFGNCENNNL